MKRIIGLEYFFDPQNTFQIVFQELITFCITAYLSQKLKLMDRKKIQEVDKVIIDLKSTQQRDR